MPGRALAGAINKLKGTEDGKGLSEDSYRLLVEYHGLVVSWLKAQSGTGADSQVSDISLKLDTKTAAVKALVGAEADS